MGLTRPVKEVWKRPRFSWLKRSRTSAEEEESPACEGVKWEGGTCEGCEVGSGKGIILVVYTYYFKSRMLLATVQHTH